MFTVKTVDSAIASLNKALANLKGVRDFQLQESTRLNKEWTDALNEYTRAERIVDKLSQILE